MIRMYIVVIAHNFINKIFFYFWIYKFKYIIFDKFFDIIKLLFIMLPLNIQIVDIFFNMIFLT